MSSVKQCDSDCVRNKCGSKDSTAHRNFCCLPGFQLLSALQAGQFNCLWTSRKDFPQSKNLDIWCERTVACVEWSGNISVSETIQSLFSSSDFISLHIYIYSRNLFTVLPWENHNGGKKWTKEKTWKCIMWSLLSMLTQCCSPPIVGLKSRCSHSSLKWIPVVSV